MEVTNLPVQYVTNQATRIIVKSAGELAPDARVFSNEEDPDSDVLLPASGEEVDPGREEYGHPDDIEGSGIDIDSYKPDIRADRSWYISETDLGKPLVVLFYSVLTSTSIFRRVDRGWLRRLGNRRRRITISSVPNCPTNVT